MAQFSNASIRVNELLRRWGVTNALRTVPFFILLCLLTWLMGFSIGEIPDVIHEGAIAPYDIRADRQYIIVNEEATAKHRTEAVQKAKMVYDYDTHVVNALFEKVGQAFTDIHNYIAEKNIDLQEVLSAESLVAMRKQFETTLDLKFTDPQWDAFAALAWSDHLQQSIEDAIQLMADAPVISDVSQLRQEREKGIALRMISVQEGKEQIIEDQWSLEQIDSIQDIDAVRAAVALTGLGRYTKAVRSFIESIIQPNCAPNLLETEARRSKLLQDVADVTETIKAGTIIARRYEPYSERQEWVLRSIQTQKATGAWPLQTIGYFFYAGLVLLLLHFFGDRHIRQYHPKRRDLIFLGVLVVVMTAIFRSGGLLSEVLAEGLPLSIPRSAYYYFIPVATGGMMVRFLLNAETAVLFCLGIAAFAGILFPQDPSFTAYVFIVNVAGASAMGFVDKRSAILRAGVVTGLYGVLAVSAIHLMRAGALSEVLTPMTLTWHIILTFGGALVAAFLVTALTPLAETFFDYTSDIKLLELANLNHPLLRELVIRAPGTYHHSHLVGILAEAGASAIGANALLARVGAYYHDIGKIRKPMYFTENQKGTSPHDRLNPHMSALIIASHVKEGIELARNYKLPQIIVDMIPQHHGTKQIGYFFEQAKAMNDPALGKVDEKDFRYPGPKPQTREAGLLLLADGIEGAVRALKEKTPARIQQTVDNIINKSFAEGQLDECEMTLQNLHEIGKAFGRILLGIYHQRVEYPREVLQLREKDVQVVEQSSESSGDDPKPTSGRRSS